MLTVTTYIIAAIALLQGILTLLDGIRSAQHMRKFRPRRASGERVVIFCPCKGTDSEFEKNIQSILDQDYQNYEAQFIVESENDPAYDTLLALGGNVLVAGRATSRGQKVHNLAYAVQHAPKADIYVFCDSDARFPRNWLSTLIAPLDSTNITSGYRWYVTNRFHFPTLMRSAWNASTVSVLGDHDRNFAWGGSTAIHSETFGRLNILDAWRGSVSDDYAVTRTAQRYGAKIVFVPECLVPSYGECSLRDLVEFTTRQIIITRVYHPALWRIGFGGYVVFNAAFWTLPFLHPSLWLTICTLSAVRSCIRYTAVQTVLPPQALSGYGWFYILSFPLVALLYLYNMAASAVSSEIVWRQIHYKLVSPNETRVARSGSHIVRLVHSVKDVRDFLESKKNIGLVPTMGALHAGHERLMEMARRESDVLAVSIFVNPLQFGPNEDYSRYPRTLSHDLETCERNGVDLVFAPSVEEMYPLPQLTFVEVGRLSEHLCGKFRSGHFRAVATVVMKLLNIVQPRRAYFGEKDMQQLTIIHRMVADLNLNVTIVGVPIVREADGLALSSRNKYLSPEERNEAPALFRALQEAASRIRGGEKDVSKVREAALAVLSNSRLIRVEYFEIVDPDELQPLATINGPVRIAGAIWVGATRLIDNVTVY